MDCSMYVCPECRKVFKVKGNNKKVKCSQCSAGLLDMNVSMDAWNVIDKANKSNIIKNILDKQTDKSDIPDKLTNQNDTMASNTIESDQKFMKTADDISDSLNTKHIDTEIFDKKSKETIEADYEKELNEILKIQNENEKLTALLNAAERTHYWKFYNRAGLLLSNEKQTFANWENAKTYFEKALECEDVSKDFVFNNLGYVTSYMANIKAELWDDAIDFLLKSDTTTAYNTLGQIYNPKLAEYSYPHKNADKAIEFYTRSIRKAKPNTENTELYLSALNNIGVIYGDVQKDYLRAAAYTYLSKRTGQKNYSYYIGLVEKKLGTTWKSNIERLQNVDEIDELTEWFDHINEKKNSKHKKLRIIGAITTILLIICCVFLIDRHKKEKTINEIIDIQNKYSELKRAEISNIDWNNHTFDFIFPSFSRDMSYASIYNCMYLDYAGMTVLHMIDNSTGDIYYVGDYKKADGEILEGKLLYQNDKVVFNKYEVMEQMKKEKEEYDRTHKKSSSSSSGSASTYNSSPEKLSTDEKVLYWTIAEKEIKSKIPFVLKNPDSAKLPFSASSDGVSIVKKDDLVTVVGWIDAKNSFDATVRSYFTVQIRLKGDKYSIESSYIME